MTFINIIFTGVIIFAMTVLGFVIVYSIISTPSQDWKKAPTEYNCTEEQMDKVQKETIFCNEKTGYVKTYCYGTAIMRNCKPINSGVSK